jgi:hypothetical protein
MADSHWTAATCFRKRHCRMISPGDPHDRQIQITVLRDQFALAGIPQEGTEHFDHHIRLMSPRSGLAKQNMACRDNQAPVANREALSHTAAGERLAMDQQDCLL